MNDLHENMNDNLTPDEILPEPAEPVEGVKSKPQKGLFRRIRSIIFCLLVVVYICATIVSGYWYLSRPVRKNQINNAYEWWTSIAEVYHLPVPKDERWGN